jgi:hypothetical protein
LFEFHIYIFIVLQINITIYRKNKALYNYITIIKRDKTLCEHKRSKFGRICRLCNEYLQLSNYIYILGLK